MIRNLIQIQIYLSPKCFNKYSLIIVVKFANTFFQIGTVQLGRLRMVSHVVVQALFGNSLSVVLVAACRIDFLVVVHCTALDIAVRLVQSLVIFSGEQGFVSLWSGAWWSPLSHQKLQHSEKRGGINNVHVQVQLHVQSSFNKNKHYDSTGGYNSLTN